MLTSLLRRGVPPNVSRRVQQYLFDRLNLRWTTTAGIRVEILNRAEWTLYNDLFVDGEYDPALEALAAAARQSAPLQIVDLGGNVGFFCLRLFHVLASRLVDPASIHVVCVEPMQANLRELHRRLGVQKGWNDRVETVRGVVGQQRTGHATLLGSRNHHMNTLLSSMAYADARGEDVPYIDVESHVPSNERVALLKCDIEGSEAAFVQEYQALLQRTDAAVFEVHHDACDVVALNRDLASAGLTVETVCIDRGNTSIRWYRRSRDGR